MADSKPTAGLFNQPSNWNATPPCEVEPDHGGNGRDGYIDVDFIENNYRQLLTKAHDLSENNEDLLRQTITIREQICILTAEVSELTLEKTKLWATFELLPQTHGGEKKYAIANMVDEKIELKLSKKALEDSVEVLKARNEKLDQENVLWAKETLGMHIEWWMIGDTIQENKGLKSENKGLKVENEELRREAEELRAMAGSGKRKRAKKEKPAPYGAVEGGASVVEYSVHGINFCYGS